MSGLRIVPRTASTLTKDISKSTPPQKGTNGPFEIFSSVLWFDSGFSQVFLPDKPQNPFPKGKPLTLFLPMAHTTLETRLSPGNGVAHLTAVVAVYRGSLVPKVILPPLVLSNMIESCSRFSFHNLSPCPPGTLGCHSAFTCSQTWKPAPQNSLTLTHTKNTHFVAFPTHTLPNLAMTQISTGFPKFDVFSNLSLYLLTIFQHPLHLLKEQLIVKFICFQDTFPSASSGF